MLISFEIQKDWKHHLKRFWLGGNLKPGEEEGHLLNTTVIACLLCLGLLKSEINVNIFMTQGNFFPLFFSSPPQTICDPIGHNLFASPGRQEIGETQLLPRKLFFHLDHWHTFVWSRGPCVFIFFHSYKRVLIILFVITNWGSRPPPPSPTIICSINIP